MPLQATSGAASYDGFGGGVPIIPNYIEDVFSTYLYTGNGTTQTITNGIDLSTKGGLVWLKGRSNAQYHNLIDTARGTGKVLQSDDTAASYNQANGLTAFNAAGFSIGNDSAINLNNYTYVSWTFRKQPKFFDIVTYTGNGSSSAQNISHSLGSTPGFIIVKRFDTGGDNWICYHTSLGSTKAIILNSTGSEITSSTIWNNTSPTSTQFTVGTSAAVNGSGSYVAYLFAHDAGGFGLTGTDNVISCGSYTGNGSATGPEIDLGYEPQWLLIKRTVDSGFDWFMYDTMRGLTATGANNRELYANLSQAEQAATGMGINSRGFQPLRGDAGGYNANGKNYIYIAIRRGPMKVPTVGTSVFKPFYASYSEGAAITTDFPLDLSMWKANITYDWSWQDRLRGWPTASGSGGPALASNTTGAETTAYQNVGAAKFDSNTGAVVSYQAASGRSDEAAYFMFRRAPSFFDEVCYTGNSTAGRTVNHNLGVAPELLIVKRRSFGGGQGWVVYAAPLGNTQVLTLQLSDAAFTFGYWNNTTPTSSVFSLNSDADVNSSSYTYVAYLFATCAGVSKVGSYTGNGSTQTINCGFTGGSRFVMIKQTSGLGGDWRVFSTAMGIVAGTDRSVRFNGNNATSTFGDTLDANDVGFELGPDSVGGGINASSETYIFLAIA
jgi:hypothetical protein